MGASDGGDEARLSVGLLVADRYRILHALGEGGMGEVYLAQQLAMERNVALKVVRGALAGNDVMQERFRREALAASRIRSRHVVTVHDFGQDPAMGRLYIAMEFLEGETLAARLERDGAMPAPEAIRIARQVCLGLEAAHEAGVVHRDLKPENVFIERDGNVKVLDFGIARIVDPASGESTHATMTATIVGTPAYISPEAAAPNKSNPVGPRSDLYSLGAMLFEMLTGRPPFDDPEPVILVGLHLRAPPERLLDVLGPGVVPDELDQLVDELLAKRPAQRPASARQVIERLDAAAEATLVTLTRAVLPAPDADPAAFDVEPDAPTIVKPAAPAPAPEAKGPKIAPVLTVLGIVGVVIAGAVGATVMHGTSEPTAVPLPPRDATVVPSPPPSEPVVVVEPPQPVPTAAPVETVVIEFEVSPSAARLEIDGAETSERRVVLPADGAEHRAVAVLGRRRSSVVTFTATENQRIRLGVASSTRPTPPSTSGTRPEEDGLLGLIRPEE